MAKLIELFFQNGFPIFLTLITASEEAGWAIAEFKPIQHMSNEIGKPLTAVGTGIKSLGCKPLV